MRPQYELADIIRQFLPSMDRKKIPIHHQRTLNALERCRTAALGGQDI